MTPIVLQWTRPRRPGGVGEPVAMAAAAAVANAFFDATGVRMRTAPFTPARVRAALKAAGTACRAREERGGLASLLECFTHLARAGGAQRRPPA